MSLSSGGPTPEQAGVPTSHPCQTEGQTTASNRRLIIGSNLLHLTALCYLCLALMWHHCYLVTAPLPRCASFAKAGDMQPGSCKTRPKYFKEADCGSTCSPACQMLEVVPSKTTTSGLEGLMEGLRVWQAVHARQHARNTEGPGFWRRPR